MSDAEDIYQQAVDAMTTPQTFERMVAFNEWAKWNIRRIITAERGPMPEQELRLRGALWIYGSDPECQQLLEEELARVSAR